LLYMGSFGLYMGISKAVEGETFWSALLFGVIAGVLFASFIAIVLARNRPEPLRQLPDGDRQTVVRIVHEGTIVEDARLAPAIIAYATYRRREREEPWAMAWVERLVCGLMALVLGYVAVISGLDGRSAATVWNAVLSSILVVMAFVLPRQGERDLQRAHYAERSARALLDCRS